MSLKELSKTSEKFQLSEPITLEELHDLMVQNQEAFPGKFKLKKGLFGASISFDVFMNVKPFIKTKENTVTVRKMQSSTKVGVGGMNIDIKATQQAMSAAKEGGIGKAVTGGQDYFLQVIEAVGAVLKDRLA